MLNAYTFFLCLDKNDHDDDDDTDDAGMEERDDISLISTVSSVGEEDAYLAEPTYNNLDPMWAQRHGFTDTGSSNLDIDAFSEEFDLRMRWDRGRGGGGSTCSTLPRGPQGNSSGHTGQAIMRPGSAVGSAAPGHQVDGGHRHSDLMNTSQLSDKTGNVTSMKIVILWKAFRLCIHLKTEVSIKRELVEFCNNFIFWRTSLY